jgi:hypothetical protein
VFKESISREELSILTRSSQLLTIEDLDMELHKEEGRELLLQDKLLAERQISLLRMLEEPREITTSLG